METKKIYAIMDDYESDYGREYYVLEEGGNPLIYKNKDEAQKKLDEIDREEENGYSGCFIQEIEYVEVGSNVFMNIGKKEHCYIDDNNAIDITKVM